MGSGTSLVVQWLTPRSQCRGPRFHPCSGKFGKHLDKGNGNPFQYSFLENSMNQRSLMGYSSWSHKESDTTERLTLALSLVGTHSGSSCLSNLCITICCMWTFLMTGLGKTGSFLFCWSQLNSIFSLRSSMVANLHPIIMVFVFCFYFSLWLPEIQVHKSIDSLCQLIYL